MRDLCGTCLGSSTCLSGVFSGAELVYDDGTDMKCPDAYGGDAGWS